jgi:hypothetical protein
MEPQPYWEPAEDAFIIHYTKTYVTAYGDDEGWDTELGLKTEIVPLSKPFGLWEHNVFQGIVKMDGEPVPYAEVEVEFFNDGLAATAPDELMITQTVKADADGVFTYAPPAAAGGALPRSTPPTTRCRRMARTRRSSSAPSSGCISKTGPGSEACGASGSGRHRFGGAAAGQPVRGLGPPAERVRESRRRNRGRESAVCRR